MKMLLDGKFSPATDCWGFLEAPFEVVSNKAVQWSKKLTVEQKRDRFDDVIHFESNLSDAIARLDPINVWKSLYISTSSNWTAVFSASGPAASGPQSEIGHLSREIHCRGLYVTAVEDTFDVLSKKGQYGGVQFALYADNIVSGQILNDRRVVGIINDGSRWEFFQEGVPEPFEYLEQYMTRRVRDRFTDRMLEEYCLALGIRLFDPDFYGPHCTLISSPYPQVASFRPIMLADVRAKLGLK